MKPITLSVKNLASYKEEILHYDDLPDLTCITGKNGAGKSSFFVDAVTFALFNQARCTDSKGTGMENLILKNEDHMEVSFKFESDGSTVEVVRRRFAKGGQELELIIDDISHTDKIKETQSKLNNIIKVDYETFLDSVCIGQGDSGRFMKKKPDERKDVFTKVLGLDKYDVLQDYTKEIRKDLNDKIKKNKENLDEIIDVVSEKTELQETLDIQTKKEKEFLEKIEEKQKELEEEISKKTKYDEAKRQRDYVVNKKRDLVSKINSIKESIEKGKTVQKNLEDSILLKEDNKKQIDEESEKLSNLQSDFTKLSTQKTSLETKNDILITNVKEIKEKHTRLKDFNEANCEFCGQSITDEHKNKHLNDLAIQGKSQLAEINNNKIKIEKLDEDIKNTNAQIIQTKGKINVLQQKKSEIEQAETKLVAVIQRLIDLKNDLKEREDELIEVNKIPFREVENQTFNDGDIKIEIANLNKYLTDCRNIIAVTKNKIENINKKEKDLKKLEETNKQLTEEVAVLDELVVAFGKDGIQAIIIDNALPEIQEEINNFLGLLTDDRVSVEFVTQKEKGKGKKVKSIETLDIVINDEYGSRTYETYSGGEKFRVDFSCHVGLAKFLAKRAGSSIRFFIVDEGIGSQDEVAKEQFVKATQKLTTMFDKVMVITHIPDIIDSFNDKVEIYKDQKNGSKIRIIS